jgi:subtilisin family serine protease
MAIEVPANRVAQLENIPGVKAVYPDIEVYEDLGESLPAIGAPTAWEIPPGFDGSGVVVGVIDGWIDWSHPALGGGFGPDYRVIGGWDFWQNQPIEASGRIGVDGRHGTHVGSTVAAVAPGAQLINYRVSSGGGGTASRLMAAMEMAIRDGVDVLTMSMGSAYGHPDAPWAKAVDNVVLSGIVFTVSNGNNGSDERTTGTYANSQLAISVGNSNARLKPIITSVGTGRDHVASLFTYSPALGELADQELEFVDCGFGALPEDFRDADGNSLVEGKVALVSRGGPSGYTGFRLKHDNARDAGAVAMIVYNNVSGGVVSGTLGSAGDIPSLGLTLEDGLLFKTLADRTIRIRIGEYNLMNAGSSRGSGALLDIKPDVAAPGTSIVAPVPYPVEEEEPVANAFLGEDGGWYASLSGTSMATPHVAGAAAILRAAYPHWTPQQVKLALMNTALDIRQENGQSYRPIDQGAGMISIPRALNTKLFINPGSLTFKDAQVGPLTLPLELISNNSRAATYRIRVAKHDPDHAYQLILDDTVTVLAGATQTLSVTLQVDEDLPVSVPGDSQYCGYIYFENVDDPNDTYRVPYHFVNGQVISQLTATPHYISLNPDATQREVTLSYVLGCAVNNVRFRVHGLSNSYFGYTGPQGPGTYSFTWDGTCDDASVTIPEGTLTIYPQFQLTEGGSWHNMTNADNIGAMAYARIISDSTAPRFHEVKLEFGDEGEVFISGLIEDQMFGLIEAGGEVLVNGEKAVVISHADFSDPDLPRGGDYGSFKHQLPSFDLREGTSVTLLGRDLAGNTTVEEHRFQAVTFDHPEMRRVLLGEHAISGRALPGLEVAINGETVPLDEAGCFSYDILIEKPGNHPFTVSAFMPGWSESISYTVRVIGVPNENAVGGK